MITAAERRVLGAVCEARLVELCSDLVRTPTVSHYSGNRQPAGELAGQELLEAVFRAMGGQSRQPLDRA